MILLATKTTQKCIINIIVILHFLKVSTFIKSGQFIQNILQFVWPGRSEVCLPINVLSPLAGDVFNFKKGRYKVITIYQPKSKILEMTIHFIIDWFFFTLCYTYCFSEFRDQNYICCWVSAFPVLLSALAGSERSSSYMFVFFLLLSYLSGEPFSIFLWIYVNHSLDHGSLEQQQQI